MLDALWWKGLAKGSVPGSSTGPGHTLSSQSCSEHCVSPDTPASAPIFCHSHLAKQGHGSDLEGQQHVSTYSQKESAPSWPQATTPTWSGDPRIGSVMLCIVFLFWFLFVFAQRQDNPRSYTMPLQSSRRWHPGNKVSHDGDKRCFWNETRVPATSL